MPQPISHKAWFITGASKGFGYVWTEAALARGDSVAAAARNVGMLDTLKVKYGTGSYLSNSTSGTRARSKRR
jgi:NADP-dependent 3-hydroxy acid dehydrogenase YdfG